MKNNKLVRPVSKKALARFGAMHNAWREGGDTCFSYRGTEYVAFAHNSGKGYNLFIYHNDRWNNQIAESTRHDGLVFMSDEYLDSIDIKDKINKDVTELNPAIMLWLNNACIGLSLFEFLEGLFNI